MTPGTVINVDRFVVIDVLTLSEGMECIFPYTPMSVFSISESLDPNDAKQS